MDDDQEAALRAGLALYTAGEYHAAHDPLEDVWLSLAADTPEEMLFHGLIQYTAAVYHARNGNWDGARGVADSGSEYLQSVPQQFGRVDVERARAFLKDLASDPERIEREPPDALHFDGSKLEVTDLDLDALGRAVDALAEEYDAYDEEICEDAMEHAKEEMKAGQAGVTTLLFDFVDKSEPLRGFVYGRLAAQIRRRRRKQDDVAGLFE